MPWSIENDKWIIDGILSVRLRINLRPSYQRQLVWNLQMQQYLIWCMLRDQDIPKLYFHVRKGQVQQHYDVVDGQQRLDTIFQFFDGTLRLSDKADPIDDIEVAGRGYGDLPEKLKSRFINYRCVIAQIDTDDHSKIVDQFLALQLGTSLNRQERRQARPGFMVKFVRDLAEHPMIELAQLSKRRAAHAEILARLVLWETHGAIVESQAQHLDDLYRAYANDSIENHSWKRVQKDMIRTLNLMQRIFPKYQHGLKNISTFTLAYWLVRHLRDDYVIDDEIATTIRKWFREFRLHIRQLKQKKGQRRLGHWSGGMGKRESNQTRFDDLKDHFFARVTNIQLKDEQRLFAPEQRDVIWDRVDGHCQWADKQGNICGFQLSEDDWHADHVIPHSQGGATSVENGRVLCPFVNRGGRHAGDCPYTQQN